MISGTQSGKTLFGPWWLVREIREKGAGDYIVATATYDLYKLKVLPAMLRVIVDILGIGRYWGGDRIIEIRENALPGGRYYASTSQEPMWARIILRSADSEGGLEAATAKAAWLDEAGQPRFTRAAWAAVRRRLAINEGRALLTSTLYDFGWLKQEFIDRFDGIPPSRFEVSDNGAEARLFSDDQVTLVQFDSILNPAYPAGDYEMARERVPSDEFDMFWRGRATKLRSMIYDVFDPKIHCVEPFEIPREWPRFAGVDPLGEQVAVVWLAFDPHGEKLFLYREYLAPFGNTTEGHVAAIRNECADERVLAWAGGGPSERQPRVDWTQYGIDLQSPTEDPVLRMDVWSQVMRVYATLAGGDLFIFNNCVNIKAEFGSYQRVKDKATGQLTDKILNKEMYHLLDALRYIITWMTDPREERRIIYMPGIINPHL